MDMPSWLILVNIIHTGRRHVRLVGHWTEVR